MNYSSNINSGLVPFLLHFHFSGFLQVFDFKKYFHLSTYTLDINQSSS